MLFNRSQNQKKCKENMAEKNMATEADTGTTVGAEQQPEGGVGHTRCDSLTMSLYEWVQHEDRYLSKFKMVPVNKEDRAV